MKEFPVRSSTRASLVGLFLIGSIAADVYALTCGLTPKLFWAYMSAAITLAGYMIYLSQMYPDDPSQVIKPQPLSWIGFGFLTGAGWIIQVAQGAEAGSWCLGITALACLVIGVWSLLKFTWLFDGRSISAACIGIALFAFSFLTRRTIEWATLSAVCATLADLAFYEPTFKKAWRCPREESVTNFTANSVKCIPALLALQSYSVATTIYLLMLTVVNGGFALFLLFRRLQLAQRSQAVGQI
jgi:hypothetical protein